MNKCCEKCLRIDGNDGGEILPCADISCPCHSQEKPEETTLEDCSGCTDRHSEGTHQMHTTQHPCPEVGDKNCGYCFPEETTTGWEDTFLNDFCEERYSSANGFLAVTKDPGKVLEFIAKERTQAKNEFAAELRESILKLAPLCGACDGAKCSHTLACNFTKNIIALLPEQPN
jgi:hypothetical protein